MFYERTVLSFSLEQHLGEIIQAAFPARKIVRRAWGNVINRFNAGLGQRVGGELDAFRAAGKRAATARGGAFPAAKTHEHKFDVLLEDFHVGDVFRTDVAAAEDAEITELAGVGRSH